MPRPVGSGAAPRVGQPAASPPPPANGAAPADRAGRADRLTTERLGHGVAAVNGESVRAAHLAAVHARGSTQPLTGVQPLVGDVAFGPAGFEVAGRKTVRRAGASRPVVRTLTEAARQLTTTDQNAFERATVKVRSHAIEHLVPFLLQGTEKRGRMSGHDVRARSASFALLLEVAGGMVARGESAKRGALIDVLLDAADHERHKGLKQQMLVGLGALAKKSLGGDQLRRRNALVSTLQQSTPPYDAWFKGQAEPKLNVVQNVQDEFWKKEISTYRQNGWDVVMKGDKSAVATRLLEDPSGKNPPVHARVQLLQRDEAVLEAMADPDVNIVLYTGHAQLGGVAVSSLELAPAAEGPPKVLGFFACRTKQNLDSLSHAFPDAHVVVSDQGTFGNDDRIVIHEMFAGIGRRASWKEIEATAEKRDIWEPNNYLFPGDRERLEHRDLDGDGRVAKSGGRVDSLYDPPRRGGRGAYVSFQPASRPAAPDTLDGAKVVDAAGWLNTAWHYWAEDFGKPGEKQMADRFRPDGWFQSADKDEIVRIEEVRAPGEKPTWRVQVNAAYANQDPHAVSMMVTFAAVQQLLAKSRPDMSEYERRMIGLALVSSYLVNVQTYSDTGDTLIRNFAKRFGFPSSLSFDVAWSAVSADHEKEASPKVIAMLERGMQYPFLEVNEERTSIEFRTYVQAALKLLKDHPTEIGRRTFELIATGRVQIDEMDDLTRPDYLHVRKEFMREGIDLPVSGFERLHDKRSKAARAIRDTMHGYMWDNRIYVERGATPDHLAQTLVHEVNHFLNASEEHYRTPEAIFYEEYRAYLSEAMLRGENLTPARRRELMEAVIRDYTLDTLSVDDLRDHPPGRFFPDERGDA